MLRAEPTKMSFAGRTKRRPQADNGGTITMARSEFPSPGEAAFTPSAATADVLFDLGMAYCIGRDVPQDYVTAHKWLNLAVLKGSDAAKAYRSEVAREMSPCQIAEAQRQARAWMTLH